MTITRATEADTLTLGQMLTSTVLPAWVRRCGQAYNHIIASISGFRFAPK